jgi:hypothetical protein
MSRRGAGERFSGERFFAPTLDVDVLSSLPFRFCGWDGINPNETKIFALHILFAMLSKFNVLDNPHNNAIIYVETQNIASLQIDAIDDHSIVRCRNAKYCVSSTTFSTKTM